MVGGVQRHLIDDLAGSCGVVLMDRAIALSLSSSKEAGSPEHGQPLKLALATGRTWPVREWPREHWQRLVDMLGSEVNVEILQICGSRGGMKAEGMRLAGVRHCFDLRSVSELVAVVATVDALVGIDSGPLHLAGALGVPVFGLFGAIDPQWRLPVTGKVGAATGGVDCLFCHHKKTPDHWITGCPRNIACMELLTPERVFRQLTSFLHECGCMWSVPCQQ